MGNRIAISASCMDAGEQRPTITAQSYTSDLVLHKEYGLGLISFACAPSGRGRSYGWLPRVETPGFMPESFQDSVG